MKALPVVEHLNEFKDLCLCLLACFVVAMMNQLGLKRGKKTLDGCIVIDVASAAHTSESTMSGQQALVASTGILATTVRMVKQSRWRLAVPNSHPFHPED